MNTIIEQLKQQIADEGNNKYIAHIPDDFLTEKKLKNFILAMQEEKEKAVCLKSLPYHIALEPTNICNLGCPLCPTGLGSRMRAKGKISMEEYKKFIDRCGDTILELYLQNWGEPTMVSYLPEMISYAVDAGIWTYVSTNFSIDYKEGYVERLVSSGLAVLQIDLDGITQKAYETYRKRGKFDLVLKNIREAIKIKKENNLKFPVIETKFLVMKHNEHQLEEYKELVKTLGVDVCTVGKIQINPNMSRDWLPENPEYYYQSYQGKATQRPCHWPWSGLVVNWDGNVSPCCIVDDPKADFGNIFQEELLAMWNNDFFVSSRAEFGDRSRIKRTTICNICKNDTMNKNLKRYKGTYGIML